MVESLSAEAKFAKGYVSPGEAVVATCNSVVNGQPTKFSVLGLISIYIYEGKVKKSGIATLVSSTAGQKDVVQNGVAETYTLNVSSLGTSIGGFVFRGDEQRPLDQLETVVEFTDAN